MVNASEATFAGPFIAAQNHFRRRLFTEEVRLTSDFSGPLNFMLGGLYEDGFFSNHAEILGNSAYKLAPRFADGLIPVDVRTYSAFGQLRWRIVPELELAGGLRWTDEKRSEAPFNYLTNRAVAVPVPVLRARNVAPEFTLTYTPTDDLTLFAAAKQNYKSGSFNVGTPASPGLNNAFRDERVRGAEVGLKSRLLDRQLALNVAGYYYRYKNLQVGARTPVSDGVPRIVTLNAASAKTYGVDFDAAFRPAGAEGLSLNLAINWNLGRYLNFDNAPCYGGQLASEGCDQLFNPLVDAYTAQDLSGTPLVRAPKWHANFGFSYERQIARDAKLILTNSNEFSSRYATFLAVGRPHDDNYQRRFLKTDLSLAVRTLDDRLEFAVIGKNISDKVTTGACTSANNAAGTILPNPSGGTERGPAGLDEVGCFAERGREVWLRLTWKPFGKGSNR
jgi:iron complex outermembrane receptor protein